MPQHETTMITESSAMDEIAMAKRWRIVWFMKNGDSVAGESIYASIKEAKDVAEKFLREAKEFETFVRCRFVDTSTGRRWPASEYSHYFVIPVG